MHCQEGQRRLRGLGLGDARRRRRGGLLELDLPELLLDQLLFDPLDRLLEPLELLLLLPEDEELEGLRPLRRPRTGEGLCSLPLDTSARPASWRRRGGDGLPLRLLGERGLRERRPRAGGVGLADLRALLAAGARERDPGCGEASLAPRLLGGESATLSLRLGGESCRAGRRRGPLASSTSAASVLARPRGGDALGCRRAAGLAPARRSRAGASASPLERPRLGARLGESSLARTPASLPPASKAPLFPTSAPPRRASLDGELETSGRSSSGRGGWGLYLSVASTSLV